MKDNGVDDDDSVSKKSHFSKVMWYLPIIPRFKRWFVNVNHVNYIRWHIDERICDGKISHVVDSLQWNKIDLLFSDFDHEPRNLRLGLVIDGMNLFDNLSTNHTSWLVLLVIYNISLWLCMKRKYMMLSMMITGPRQPKNNIYVYLSPLIKYSERKTLMLIMRIQVKVLRCVSCCFTQSTIFPHTIIISGILLRNIKRDPYLKLIHH